jgi:Ca2+-binding EF-hand superfamily protein
MLGKSTRYKVWQLFKAIGENEMIVEEQRQQLANQSGFEPWAAFRRIDRDGTNKISAQDVNEFLRENMVDYLSEAECYHLFNYFDQDQDGFLDYQEYAYQACNFVLLVS